MSDAKNCSAGSTRLKNTPVWAISKPITSATIYDPATIGPVDKDNDADFFYAQFQTRY